MRLLHLVEFAAAGVGDIGIAANLQAQCRRFHPRMALAVDLVVVLHHGVKRQPYAGGEMQRGKIPLVLGTSGGVAGSSVRRTLGPGERHFHHRLIARLGIKFLGKELETIQPEIVRRLDAHLHVSRGDTLDATPRLRDDHGGEVVRNHFDRERPADAIFKSIGIAHRQPCLQRFAGGECNLRDCRLYQPALGMHAKIFVLVLIQKANFRDSAGIRGERLRRLDPERDCRPLDRPAGLVQKIVHHCRSGCRRIFHITYIRRRQDGRGHFGNHRPRRQADRHGFLLAIVAGGEFH